MRVCKNKSCSVDCFSDGCSLKDIFYAYICICRAMSAIRSSNVSLYGSLEKERRIKYDQILSNANITRGSPEDEILARHIFDELCCEQENKKPI